MDTYTPAEQGLIDLARLCSPRDTLKIRRLRLIERWRYQAFLASFDNLEPGQAPYGVNQ